MAAAEQNHDIGQGSEKPRREGLLTILQNNEDRSLLIHAMNETLETLLGYQSGELIGRKFEVVLGHKTAHYLAEEMEYTADAADLGELIGSQREIRLRPRMGEEITVPCRVSRILSSGVNARFEIVIPNPREVVSGQKVREFIALNLAGHQQLDPVTGLPNRETAIHFFPLLKNYLAESNIQACFAVLRLDRHQKSLGLYGRDACAQLLQHAANCCKSTFRTEDLIFALSDHTFGLLLVDISRESARVVLNRLRWNIRTHRIVFGGKSEFSVTTSIGFDMLDPERGDQLIARCESAIAGLDVSERNGLIELGN